MRASRSREERKRINTLSKVSVRPLQAIVTLACPLRVGDAEGFIAVKARQVDLMLFPSPMPPYRQGAPTELRMMQPPYP